MAEDSLKKKTISGLFWTFFERIGVQLVSFFVQIILARLLLPEEYGVISIVLIFINLCNVFVESGFGRALIQKKNADDLDYSSVFYICLTAAAVFYFLLYAAAPYIAAFYKMPLAEPVLRVMGLRLFVASFNAIQRAKISKEMQFRRFFLSTLGGMLVSAAIGIFFAYWGFGVWALVAQDLSNITISTLILFLTVRWRPRLQFSWERAAKLFRYGWKVLANSLVETLYEDFRGLYIGKLYNADALAFYSRGRQFPYLIVDNVNSSINSVLFPALSSRQDDREAVVGITRRAMKTSAYVLSPMLFGLAALAEPLVLCLLTEKWLPCVPFLQILSINAALVPMQTANAQTLYAIGRSDIVVRLNVIKKSFGLIMVIIFARISVLAMAWAGVATGVFSLIVNTYPNKKLLGYGIVEQIRDVAPCWLLSGAMIIPVMAVRFIGLPLIPELGVMVLVGMVTYVLLSMLFKADSFVYILNTITGILAKRKKK